MALIPQQSSESSASILGKEQFKSVASKYQVLTTSWEPFQKVIQTEPLFLSSHGIFPALLSLK